jgi:hypothetical protein
MPFGDDVLQNQSGSNSHCEARMIFRGRPIDGALRGKRWRRHPPFDISF